MTIEQSRSEDSVVDAIGVLSLEGFTGIVGGSLFLGFFDTADSMAIGDRWTQFDNGFFIIMTFL